MLQSRDSEYGTYSSRLAPERDIASTLEEIIIVIIVMVFAAGIRFWKLGAWSVWIDEVLSVQGAKRFPDELTVTPIIYMIVRAFTDLFGMSEWSARLGPCIIGILSVPLLYLLAKRMFNANVAMLACAFLVIHPWHIFWSQNARAYSLAFLFASSSAFLFYLALERDRIGLTLSSLLLALLSILSYFQTVLLLPALAGYVILLLFIPAGIPKGLNGKNLIAFFGPFILALLLLLSPSVRNYIYSGWGSNEWGPNPLYILLTLIYCLAVPIAVAALVGGIHSLLYLKRNGLFLICYSVVPLLLLLIASLFLNVRGYYIFFTVPAYLLLAAFCASELMESAQKKSRFLSASVVLIVLITLLSQDYLYFRVENGGRPKWREAFQTVKYRIGFDDIVIASVLQVAEYYLGEFNGEFSPPKTPVVKLEDVIEQLGVLEGQWRRKNQQAWFILDQPHLSVLDADNKFREWLHANCRLIEEFPVYARVMDRTIRIWHLAHTKTDSSDEFDEIFTF